MTENSYSMPIRVYYEDTDAGGIVYNANYLKYFERVRSEWFRALGIDQAELLEQDVGFVVRKVEMDNLLPARFNSLLTAHCRIAKLRKASLIFEQKITNEQGQIICTGIFTIASVSLAKMKPVQFPANITEVLNIVV